MLTSGLLACIAVLTTGDIAPPRPDKPAVVKKAAAPAKGTSADAGSPAKALPADGGAAGAQASADAGVARDDSDVPAAIRAQGPEAVKAYREEFAKAKRAAADGGTAAPVGAPMAPEVKALVDRVQAFYEQTKDFSADFRQDYFYKASRRTTTSSGKVRYAKPAVMRWDYEKPSARHFVLAADRVYFLDPEAKLLTIASIATNNLSASVTFLWGQGKLADEFSIVQKPCEKCAGTLLELTPLVADPRFKRIRLEVDPKTASVMKSTVVDPDGSENAITFSNLVTNTGLTAESFKLVPPPGTQVQDFRQGPAAPKPAAPADAGMAPAK